MIDRVLSVKDLTDRYGVTENTVLGWIRAGELRAVNVGRKAGSKKPRWRITPEALRAFETIRTPSLSPTSGRRRKRSSPDVIEFY